MNLQNIDSISCPIKKEPLSKIARKWRKLKNDPKMFFRDMFKLSARKQLEVEQKKDIADIKQSIKQLAASMENMMLETKQYGASIENMMLETKQYGASIENMMLETKQHVASIENMVVETKLRAVNIENMAVETKQYAASIENIVFETKLRVGKIEKSTADIESTVVQIRPNISWQMQLEAAQKTAQYVVENMLTVNTYTHSHELLSHAISHVSVENGLWLEFGVWSGRTINHISSQTSEIVFGFDSFEGLPEAWRTGFSEGCFKKDTLPKVNENVQLVQGWFNATLPVFLEATEKVCAFIHVDCDLYSSTKTIFENLKARIQDGTIIVFDEYFNYPGWEQHEFKAFQEFIHETGFKYEFLGYVPSSEQVAIRLFR